MNSPQVVRIVFAVAAFIACRASAQTPAWSQFSASPSVSRHDDICPVNETIAYTASGTAGIYKTTDGGKTWTQKAAGYSATHFRCIGFADAQHGWAGNLGAGSYDTVMTDTNNILYETFDGGNTWSNRPGFYEAGMKGLCSMHVFDPQTIYGVGRVRGPAYFIKSTDGGTNWSITNLTAGGVMGGLMDVYFKDKTNGFAVGMDTNDFYTQVYHGAIARTTNGGLSWNVVASTAYPNCYFWKMSWPTPDIGYVSLQKNPISSDAIVYYKTTDGGATWTSNGVPVSAVGISSFYWQGIGFVSPTEGWAGGDGSMYINNFLHTTDGGASWTRMGYNDSRRINRIRVLNSNMAFASGTRVHVFRIPLTNAIPPQSLTVPIGSTATFSNTSFGTAPLIYQWRHAGTNLPGATTNSFSVTNVQSTNAGNYDVIVGDYSGSLTSIVAVLTVSVTNVAPTINTQPQSLSVFSGQNAFFTVSASGSAPLSYQWLFNGTNLAGATDSGYTRANSQPAHAGNYSVVVTNVAGSVTSAVAALTVTVPIVSFQDDFDSYASPSTVTSATTTNGYKIFFRAASGGMDFKAIFGFNYSTITFPTNIPPAPHSVGGTTKGLYLTVNKDATMAAAAVNLYPTGQLASGNFSLKYDLWINYRDPLTSTEHALAGINHSANVTNRIGQSPSDGLFFVLEGEADSAPTSTTLRDYSVFRGGGSGTPVLITTNNTAFGPTPLLAPQFDNGDPGLMALFPAQTIPGYGTTASGTAGLRWLSGEVRQVNNLVTWILNGAAIAQYTNTFAAYTNGTIMLGYNDNFPSIGDSNNFAIFDNVRVEPIVLSPVQLLSPQIVGNNFAFSFATEPYESYTVQWATNLTSPTWLNLTNFAGNGAPNDILVPLNGFAPQYFRVSRP